MIKHNQDGAANGLVISLILTIVILVGMIGFAGWAFSSRQDYKNNTDKKVAAAVEVAKQQESDVKDAEFVETVKNPFSTYKGPEAFGTINLKYPKTWSAYISDKNQSSGGAIDAYFAPGILNTIGDPSTVIALHVQVLNQSYVSTLASLSDRAAESKTAITAYKLPKMPNILGSQIVGNLDDNEKGVITTEVILPLRSQTIILSTSGDQFLNDFNKSILPNFSFIP